METKKTAQTLLARANEFVIFTDECVMADSHYDTIEKMIITACKQPEFKLTFINALKKVMRNDMLPLLN